MFLFSMLAVVSAALMPLPASSQVNPEAAPGPEQGGATYKYEAYAGAAYTPHQAGARFVQRIAGRKGVTGPRLGKIFSTHGIGGLLHGGDRPRWISESRPPDDLHVHGWAGAPCQPLRKFSGLVFAEVGGEHTGGENMTPSISFAGGFGGGLAYNLSRKFGRATYRRPRRRIVLTAQQYSAACLLDQPHLERTRNHRCGVPVLRAGHSGLRKFGLSPA